MKWFRKCLLGSAALVGGVFAFAKAITIFPTPTSFMSFFPHVVPQLAIGGLIGMVPVLLFLPLFRRLKEETEEDQPAG